MVIEVVTFYIMAFVMVASALTVIIAKNPVHSVLFLILAFFSSAGLFILLGAEFIAMLIVIVYVGAVAVLFLFIIMMLNIDFGEFKKNFVKNLPLALLVAIIILAELIITINVTIPGNYSGNIFANVQSVAGQVDNTKAIGKILYTDYFLAFQLSGLILLVAMVGAIVLTLRVRGGVKKQDITKQINRTREAGVKIVKVNFKEGV